MQTKTFHPKTEFSQHGQRFSTQTLYFDPNMAPTSLLHPTGITKPKLHSATFFDRGTTQTAFFRPKLHFSTITRPWIRFSTRHHLFLPKQHFFWWRQNFPNQTLFLRRKPLFSTQITFFPPGMNRSIQTRPKRNFSYRNGTFRPKQRFFDPNIGVSPKQHFSDANSLVRPKRQFSRPRYREPPWARTLLESFKT